VAYVLLHAIWWVAEYEGGLGRYALVCPNSDNTQAWLMGSAVCHAYITVRPDNTAAYHLHQRFGFTQQGNERPDHYGTGEPRKVLHRSLATYNPYPPNPGPGTRRRPTSRWSRRNSR